MAQDLDYNWEAYEKGWRGQPQQIKFTNDQLNLQIQQLTLQMNNAQERLLIEMRNRENIQRRNITPSNVVKKKRGRKAIKKKIKSNVMTPLEHSNQKITSIQNQISSYSKQIGQLNAQLNSNT